MVLIKLKKDTYGVASDYLHKSLEYIYNPQKAKYINAFGVAAHDVDSTESQMKHVKGYFHRNADNPLIHIIVSFPKEIKTLQTAIELALHIAFYFKDEHQVIWCIHYKATERSFYHVHYIINPVCFKDGKLYNSSHKNLYDFTEYVETRTGLKSMFFYGSPTSSDDL